MKEKAASGEAQTSNAGIRKKHEFEIALGPRGDVITRKWRELANIVVQTVEWFEKHDPPEYNTTGAAPNASTSSPRMKSFNHQDYDSPEVSRFYFSLSRRLLNRHYFGDLAPFVDDSLPGNAAAAGQFEFVREAAVLFGPDEVAVDDLHFFEGADEKSAAGGPGGKIMVGTKGRNRRGSDATSKDSASFTPSARKKPLPTTLAAGDGAADGRVTATTSRGNSYIKAKLQRRDRTRGEITTSPEDNDEGPRTVGDRSSDEGYVGGLLFAGGGSDKATTRLINNKPIIAEATATSERKTSQEQHLTCHLKHAGHRVQSCAPRDKFSASAFLAHEATIFSKFFVRKAIQRRQLVARTQNYLGEQHLFFADRGAVLGLLHRFFHGFLFHDVDDPYWVWTPEEAYTEVEAVVYTQLSALVKTTLRLTGDTNPWRLINPADLDGLLISYLMQSYADWKEALSGSAAAAPVWNVAI
eukprot:g9397.t1